MRSGDKQPEGHKCSGERSSPSYFNWRGLEEFPEEESFFALYTEVGFPKGEDGLLMFDCEEETFEVLKKICDSCPCGSKARRGSCLAGAATGTSCPFEEEFSKGIIFSLTYPITRKDCPRCGKEVGRFYLTGSSTVWLADVRCKGMPVKLKISREEGICPYCKQRLPAEKIAYVQIDLKRGVTLRLLRGLTRHYIERGFGEPSRRKVAEGYAISPATVKKYATKLCEDVRKEAEQLLSDDIIEKYNSKRWSYSPAGASGLRYYSVPLTNYPLKLYFAWPVRDTEGKSIVLRAAFGREEQVLDAWTRGDFTVLMPARMSSDHLTILAHYYSGAEFKGWPHTFLFDMAWLTIQVGKAITKHKEYPDNGKIEKAIACCWDLIRFDNPRLVYLYFVENTLNEIWKWARAHHLAPVCRALDRVFQFLGLPMDTYIQPEAQGGEVPEQTARRLARRVGAEISRNRQIWDAEDPLALPTRLLYLNEAALIRHQDGRLPILQDGSIDPRRILLSGIPVDALMDLLSDGLLGERGPQYKPNIPHSNSPY